MIRDKYEYIIISVEFNERYTKYYRTHVKKGSTRKFYNVQAICNDRKFEIEPFVTTFLLDEKRIEHYAAFAASKNKELSVDASPLRYNETGHTKKDS